MLKTAICGWSARGSNRRITKTLLVMKLTIFFLITACLQVSAKSSNAQTVTFKGKDVPLEKVFAAIRQQTVFVFLYNDTLLKDAKPVTIDARHVSVMQLLDQVLKEQGLKYIVESRTIIVYKAIKPANPATDNILFLTPPFPVHVRVVDADGKMLAGASVTNKKTKASGITDAGGICRMNVSTGDVLTISFVGFGAVEHTIAGPSEDLIVIKLTPSLSPLDELQIVAYGTTTRRLNTADISTVKAADIEKQPVGNPLAALEGRVPGLLISQSNGVPGSSFSVQIRGQNSLAQGSDPLFVVDGVPFAPNNTTMIGLSSSVGPNGLSPLNSINPSDIESIEVLKDADATSIYGSRGANGVILINTKKGKAGKTTFNANVYTGASVVTRTMDMMNTQQYLAMRREALKNDGVTPAVDNFPEGLAYDTGRYIDYKKYFFGGTSHTTDAQLSLTGGSGSTQFLMGGDFHNESTIYPGSMYDRRFSFHSNVSHASADKKLKASLSTNYVVDDNHLSHYDFAAALLTAPNMPAPYDSAGNVVWEKNGATLDHPEVNLLRSYTGNTSNLLGSLQVSYQLLPGLTLKADMGYNMVRLDETLLMPIKATNPTDATTGSAGFTTNVFKSWNVEPQAEYTRIMGKGRLNILAGSTWQETVNSTSAISADGITNDALIRSISAATTISATSSYNQYRYNAVFGRIGYSWMDKYILNLTGRRDGSSRFGPGRQFANFGAAGAAWIFTKEDWHLPPFLSFGKLRASYGASGNDQIGNYQYLDTWSSPTYPYNGMGGLYPTQLSNPDYGWEVNRKLEGALELGFLKDRILFTGSWFLNRSGNQLISYKLPSQTGFPTITENFPALVQNKGLEFLLNTKNIQARDFSWTTSVNITFHRNKLVKFPGLATSSYANTYIVGQSLNVIKGYHYLGVNDTTGVFQFLDVDKDGALTTADNFVLGSRDPKFYGGLQNSFTYKGWQLDLFVEFRKQVGQNYLYTIYSKIPGTINNNMPVSLENRWRNPGDHAEFQKVTQSAGAAATAAQYFIGSSGAYSDASFIRLKNVSLSYSLSPRLLKPARLQAVRVYLHMQNLLTITSYPGTDPEVKELLSLPLLRTMTGGIQITL